MRAEINPRIGVHAADPTDVATCRSQQMLHPTALNNSSEYDRDGQNTRYDERQLTANTDTTSNSSAGKLDKSSWLVCWPSRVSMTALRFHLARQAFTAMKGM